MKNGKNGSIWFKEAVVKRNAQTSSVIVFKTADPRRLKQFIEYLHKYYKNKNVDHTIYLFESLSGLKEISIEDGEIKYSRVYASTGLEQLLGSGQRAPITSLEAAIRTVFNMMDSEETDGERRKIVFIIRVLFEDMMAPSEQMLLKRFIQEMFSRYELYAHTLVIFTDAPEELIGRELLRYTIYVKIPPSTEDERRAILKSITKNLKIKAKNIESLVKATRGLNLHEVESVALESFYRYQKLDPRTMTEYKYDIIRKSGLVDIEEPRHGFEAIGGYKALKEFVRRNIINILVNPKKAEKLGIDPPRGILLFGPPGTGKTWFAKALARELNLPFLRFKAENVVSELYGQTTRNIGKVIEIAEAVAPCVLFIDEIDRFGRRGHLTEHEESRRAFSVLLEWLGDENRRTIVIGTTNRPEDLDEAFIRVGRFDYIIPVLYPDYSARKEILNVHTKVVRRVPLEDDVDIDKIAKKTSLWAGAELKELVMRAARKAMEEDSEKVAMKHFDAALSTFRINVERRRAELDKYLKLVEEFTNDAEFIENIKRPFKDKRF